MKSRLGILGRISSMLLAPAIILTSAFPASAVVKPTLIPGPVHMMISPKAPVDESVVEIRGQTYHLVEYQNTTFFFQLMQAPFQGESGICRQIPTTSLSKVTKHIRETKMTYVPLALLDSMKTKCGAIENVKSLGIALGRAKSPVYNPLETYFGFQSDF